MNHLEVAEIVLRDLKLAKLARSLMGGVRYIHESDKETLQRVIKEYTDAKYRGKKTPKDWRKE